MKKKSRKHVAAHALMKYELASLFVTQLIGIACIIYPFYLCAGALKPNRAVVCVLQCINLRAAYVFWGNC